MHDDRARQLLERLERDEGALLAIGDRAAIIAELDRVAGDAAYHVLPTDARSHWRRLLEHPERRAFSVVLRGILLDLILAFEHRAAGRRYTPAIIECFERSFERILGDIASPDYAGYATVQDLLIKDLALCRQHMFPAGAQVVDPDASFSRSLLYSGGIAQTLAFGRLMMNLGGNDHFYQIHTHLGEMADFNPEGWDRCYLRLAGMLRLNPQARGMYGGSWFYDPVLETVSPRLVYLRKVPQDNGAHVFYVRPDTSGDALAKSESRRQLHEQGRYNPAAYAVIWPRDALLAWAERVSRG